MSKLNASGGPVNDPAEAAIATVLRAEREARAAVERSKAEASQLAELARAGARSVAERTERRIRAVVGAFERELAQRLGEIDAEAALVTKPHELSVDERAALDRAVGALARELTGSGTVIESGSLEFAQARLQARHGQRASAAAWQRLETTREFGALLEVARSSPLRPWLVGITTASTSHQIELTLRAHWRALVAEVAAWMPAAWQASMAWCAVLADLPVLQHLARGGEPSDWMHDDADYRALCAVPPGERRAALAAGKFGALASAWTAPVLLARTWLAEWQRRLPERPGDGHDTLHQLTAAFLEHGTAFAAAPPGPGGLLRRSLQARLMLLLRRATLEPAAAFIHVALCALDLERLRGELLSRLLFAQRQVA